MTLGGWVAEQGHAEVDQAGPPVGPGSFEAAEFGERSVHAHLEALDFAEPAVAAGFEDPVAQVLDDLDESGPLARVQLQDGAADAGLSGLRAGRVGRSPKFDLQSNEIATVWS
ncbi:hypothetical protein [Streptacidiphilus albus]|uniref:hypothetical protein n=1 Tax=Streptacidiphilus albus TaxID=105425 RepID=UPI00054C0926|nr:hypothetical protein [Streptacidiphilus albus]